MDRKLNPDVVKIIDLLATELPENVTLAKMLINSLKIGKNAIKRGLKNYMMHRNPKIGREIIEKEVSRNKWHINDVYAVKTDNKYDKLSAKIRRDLRYSECVDKANKILNNLHQQSCQFSSAGIKNSCNHALTHALIRLMPAYFYKVILH